MGIEPTLSAWKAGVLPLNYTRTTVTATIIIHNFMFQCNSIHQNKLMYSRVSYPLHLEAVVGPLGLEPRTNRL